MIFGECPYCENALTFDVPDRTPAFSHQTCDSCGKTFWEYHSRFDPSAYTEEAFALAFEIDEQTRTITERQL